MPSILEQLHGVEERHFDPGQIVIEQGRRSGLLFFLLEGAVEVVKDGTRVATASQPGAVFGEMSTLLGGNHTATVRALKSCTFRVVENPHDFLANSPAVCLHVCELVAHRLDAVNQYLVDVKQQFEGHEHLGMVDGILETLMHRHPSERVRPSESTISQGESSN
jgi:CRP/FNR family transcriptional regulator, cyclic AMP receptor protein